MHGEALGPEATKATKKNLGFPEDKSFYVPEAAGKHWLESRDAAKAQEEWQKTYEPTRRPTPSSAPSTTARTSMKLAEGWEKVASRLPNG